MAASDDPFFTTATLRFWHGGKFKEVNNRLNYVGGEGKTKRIDLDELCWFTLKEMVQECGGYNDISEIWYLMPNCSLDNGLKKVYNDDECIEMGKLLMKSRSLDLYVVHGVDTPNVLHKMPEVIFDGHYVPVPKSPKKLIPRRQPIEKPPESLSVVQRIQEVEVTPPKKVKQSTKQKVTPPLRSSPRFNKSCTNPHIETLAPQTEESSPKAPKKNCQPLETQPEDYHDFYDERPESPIPLDDLLGGQSDSSDSDPGYDPQESAIDSSESDGDGFVVDEALTEGEQSEREIIVENIEQADSDDDELREARQRVKLRNAELINIAEKLRRQIDEGTFGSVKPTDGTEGRSDSRRREGDKALSDYEDSDDGIHTPIESDDEDFQGRRSRRFQLVGEGTDWSTFTWGVGQRFRSREAFRDAVAHYAITQGRNLCFADSNKNKLLRLEAKCLPGCPFRVYGSWDKRRACFLVKAVNGEHCCTRNMTKNKQLKSSWLAKQLLEVFKSRPHWPGKEIQETVRQAYKVAIRISLAYRVKYAAHKMLHGSMKEHYNKLGRYLQAIQDADPDCHVDLCTLPSKQPGGPPIFRRLFICFSGLKKGWIEGCRKLLCIDSCFLKTFLGGQLMAAIGRDANEQMYPVLWAVVEGENSESWEWFMQNMQKCLQLGDGAGLTVISDENPALLTSVASVLPMSEHRHCARHIFAHWHKAFRGDDFKLKFWTAAKSYSMADYEEAMENLGLDNTAAVEAFKGYDPTLFCRAFLKCDTKVDVIVNNLAETFNGYIINSRTKHILYMLEEIRSNLMQRLVVKRLEMEKKNQVICPRVQAKLEQEKSKAAMCDCFPSTMTKFQVNYYLDTLAVDLESRSCTCRKWDLTGVPCCHAIACIYFCKMEAEDFVHECFRKDTYLKSYTVCIPPIQGERHWPKVTMPLDPPPIKIGPGRPRKNRIKDPFENPKKPGKLTKHGVQMSCSRCKSTTHNVRRCKVVPTTEGVQQPPQKKRKTAQPSQPISTQASTSSAVHHEATAQPTRTGRGGRVIRGGLGARGGKGQSGGRGQSGTGAAVGGGQGRGRGRPKKVPQGFGLLVGDDGTTYVNPKSRRGRPRKVQQDVASTSGCPIGSQSSTANT